MLVRTLYARPYRTGTHHLPPHPPSSSSVPSCPTVRSSDPGQDPIPSTYETPIMPTAGGRPLITPPSPLSPPAASASTSRSGPSLRHVSFAHLADQTSSSSSPPAASTSAAAPPARRSGPTGDDIEMEPVVGHRRRKSSLINPAGTYPPPHVHRARLSITIPRESREDADKDGSAKDESPRDGFSDDDLHDDEEMGLSSKDRSRRRKKRRRNRQLDNRIAPEKDITTDELQEVDKDVAKKLVVNALFILLWYVFSLSISLVSISHLPAPLPLRDGLLTAACPTVQQVDVRQESPQLCLSALYHLDAHARAVRSRWPGSVPCAVFEAAAGSQLGRRQIEARDGTQQLGHVQNVLSHAHRTLRCRHRSRHRAR